MQPTLSVERHVVWVDPEIGFCPRRVETRWKAGSYLSTTFEDYREVHNGVWFPMKQEVRVVYSDGELVSTNRVQEVHVGAAFKKEDLLVQFPTGTKITVKGTEISFEQP